MENKTFKIQEIAYLFKKKLKLVIAIILLSTILASAYAFLTVKPSYLATVKIFSGKEEKADVYSQDELSDNSTLINTYIELIKTDNFMNKIISKTGVNATAEGLKKSVNFTSSGNIPILKIEYVNPNSETAKKVVSAISDQFEEEVKTTILNINTKVIEDVKVTVIMQSKAKLIMLGFIMGLILAIGMVLLLDYLDNTIKNKEDLEKIISIPVLGELPKEKKLLKK